MSPKSLSREEQALDEFLATASETIAVCLTEPFHPGSQMMADRLLLVTDSLDNFHSISIGYETHRPWAEKHRAFGTPVILVFRNGRLVRRLNGVFTEEQLHDLLGTA